MAVILQWPICTNIPNRKQYTRIKQHTKQKHHKKETYTKMIVFIVSELEFSELELLLPKQKAYFVPKKIFTKTVHALFIRLI